MDANFLGVGHAIAVTVAKILQPNRLLGIVLAEKVAVLVFVASGNQFLQAQLLEVVAEIMEKVAHTRVVAVAKHRFPLEMRFVVLQFVLNINKLSIELILLCIFRLVQVFVGHTDNSYCISIIRQRNKEGASSLTAFS